MIKRVRRRPKHTAASAAKRGVVYLPRPFIGTMVKVLTKGQYKTLLVTIKQLRRKVYAIRKVVYEYSRT